MTDLLRSSEEDLWTRLREALRERDLDPMATVVAESFPDDSYNEFGVLVVRGPRVIQFDLDWDWSGSLAQAELTWNDLTQSWTESPYRSNVQAALTELPPG